MPHPADGREKTQVQEPVAQSLGSLSTLALEDQPPAANDLTTHTLPATYTLDFSWPLLAAGVEDVQGHGPSVQGSASAYVRSLNEKTMCMQGMGWVTTGGQ